MYNNFDKVDSTTYYSRQDDRYALWLAYTPDCNQAIQGALPVVHLCMYDKEHLVFLQPEEKYVVHVKYYQVH